MADSIRRKRSVLGDWIVKYRRKSQNLAQHSFTDGPRESRYETPPVDYSDDDSFTEANHSSLPTSRRTSILSSDSNYSPPRNSRTTSVSVLGKSNSPNSSIRNRSLYEVNRSSPPNGERNGVRKYLKKIHPFPHDIKKNSSISSYDMSHLTPGTQKTTGTSAFDGNRSSPNSRRALNTASYNKIQPHSLDGRMSPSILRYEKRRPSTSISQKSSSNSSYDMDRSSPLKAPDISFHKRRTSPENAKKIPDNLSLNRNGSTTLNNGQSRCSSSSGDDYRKDDEDSNDGYFTPPVDYSDSDSDQNDNDYFDSDVKVLPQHKKTCQVPFGSPKEQEDTFQRPVNGGGTSPPENVTTISPDPLKLARKNSELNKKSSSISIPAKKPSRVRFWNVEELDSSSDDFDFIDKGCNDSMRPQLPLNENVTPISPDSLNLAKKDPELNKRSSSVSVPVKKPSSVRFWNVEELDNPSVDFDLVGKVSANPMRLHLPLNDMDPRMHESDSEDSKFLTPVDYESLPKLFTGLTKTAAVPGPAAATRSEEMKSNVEGDDAQADVTDPNMKLPSASRSNDLASWIAASVQKANAYKKKLMKENLPDIFDELPRCGGMDDGGSSLSSASYGSCSSSGAEEVVLRIHVPELSVERCLTFHSHDLVWTVKQAALTSLPKELRESFNYGLFCPPQNGRAGKFLDEERPLSDYPLCSPLGYLELKYKRRVYKMLKLEEKTLRALHSRANLRRFLEWVKEGNVEKVAKMCSKGLDPNFHDQETGDTPLTIAARGHMKARKGCAAMLVALVNGGALLDYRTREGLTAMHRAVQADNLHAVRTLLDLGASPNYRDHRGLTPLYYCVTHAKDPLVCEALLHDYAIIGVADHQGWQETHQACRNKLVQHLEHLLFYGADLNGRNASGNTPLHVCAVNNLEDCARVLLFRGCDKNALNYANQNPYQVAVISGNLELAEIINKHQPEDVVPFKSPPRYNPRRRVSGAPLLRATSDPRLENPCVHKPPSPAPSSRSIPPFSSASSLSEASTGSGSTASNNSSSAHPADVDHDAQAYESRTQSSSGGGGGDGGRENFSDTSSGIGSSYQGTGSDGIPARPAAQLGHPYQPNSAHGNVAEADEEEEEDDSESDSNNHSSSSSSSSDGSGNGGGVSSLTYDVGTLVVCVKQQVAVDSTQLSLNLGDIVQVSGSTDDGLLEGTTRGVTGTFPPSCVQPVRLRNPQAARDTFAQQQLIRTKSHSGYSSDQAPAPHSGATHYGTAPRARKTQMPLSRTVVLHRGKKGFGFVLRGAKAMSPLMERLGEKGVIALQYLDDVDPDGVADLAGLKKGDYLLKINGEDVSQASHERVVSLIRKSADLVEMTVVTPTAEVLAAPPPASFSPQKLPFTSNNAVRGSQTLPRKHNFSRSSSQANTPPAPPPRDPSTSLSVGRARARSVVGSLQQHSADCSENLSPSSTSGLPKLASIKARPASALRMTASQVEEMISQNTAGSLPPSPSNSSDARPPRVYASVAEMKKAKALRSRPPADSRLHKVFHSTPDLTPVPICTAPGALSSDLNLQSYPGNNTALNHPNSRHSMADPPQEEYSGSSPATGFYPKRVSQYDSGMHGSLDHRKLKRSQSAINSSQLLRDDGTVSPSAGAGQLVKVDISRSNSEYASVAQSVKSPGDPDSNPTSPGIMSSFRPSDSAKLYASPEEIKSVGYRNPQMLAQLNRKSSNYAVSAKNRSQSLPPTTNRNPVSRLSSDPYADPIDKAASHGDSPVDDDDLPLPPPPPEAELITYARPQNNRIVTEANSVLMTTSCIVNKSGLIYDQNKQMSASFSGPSSSQCSTNCGYSSEEENTYNSQYGDELNSRTIKRKKHSVAFAPNLVKSDESSVKIKEISHYAAPVASCAPASAAVTSSTSSPSKAQPASQTENFSDLIAKKAEERRARLENGGNSSAPGSTNSSPNRKTVPPKASKGLSDAILESALFNKQKEKVSNGENSVSTEARSKVGSVGNILQKMKNSKSFPSEFTQEDGENSSSGVSSDQEIQQDGTSFVTVINTESNSISETKPKLVMPKSNSVEEFSVSSESSEDASDRTCILTNDKTSSDSSKEGSSITVPKKPGTRSKNVVYASKLPSLKDQLETSPSVAAVKKNGASPKVLSEEAVSNQSSSNHSLPISHPLATSQPLPGHLQEAIHPSNTHVGQAKFSTLQRPQSNSKRFTKAGSDPPSGQNYASGGGTLIRSRSINREELNLNSGSATLDRNFYQANKGGSSSGKAEYERSIDESLQLIRMHMNSLNEVNSLAGIKASHPINENLRETDSLSTNANKESASARVEEVLAPPPQFSDTSGGQFCHNGSEEASGRGKPSLLREIEDEPDVPIRVYKRSNRRVEEDFVAAADDGRSFRYKTLDEWSTKDTTDWLESLFMPEYKDSFETKQIDGAKLLKINNESLINLGVRRVGHRVNMEKSLKRYRPVERIDL